MLKEAVDLKMVFDYKVNSSVAGALPQPRSPQTNS